MERLSCSLQDSLSQICSLQPDFHTPLPRTTQKNKQCHSLPRRMTAPPPTAAEVGLVVKGSRFPSEALPVVPEAQGWGRSEATQALYQVLQEAMASGRRTLEVGPLSALALLLLPLAGRQTVILLIAFTTAKPPGQQSHLEKKWTESSAHRLRIPKTTSPRSQPSFCK